MPPPRFIGLRSRNIIIGGEIRNGGRGLLDWFCILGLMKSMRQPAIKSAKIQLATQ